MWKRNLFALSVIVGSAGCAQTQNDTASDPRINEEIGVAHPNDPFERFNRAMWVINYDYLDPYVARPASLFYANIIPSFARTGISNFISNLEEPSSMVNSLFMQEGDVALMHFNRFWINTTFGIGGILDIASAAGIYDLNQPQFGDVMGYYGVAQGPYFMLPIYGPFTIRDGAGDLVDGIYAPLSLLTFPQSFLKWLLDSMERRAALIPQEDILKNSPDPYAFARDVYLQNKAFNARGNKEVDESSEKEFNDEEFLDEIDDY